MIHLEVILQPVEKRSLKFPTRLAHRIGGCPELCTLRNADINQIHFSPISYNASFRLEDPLLMVRIQFSPTGFIFIMSHSLIRSSFLGWGYSPVPLSRRYRSPFPALAVAGPMSSGPPDAFSRVPGHACIVRSRDAGLLHRSLDEFLD